MTIDWGLILVLPTVESGSVRNKQNSGGQLTGLESTSSTMSP